MKLPIYVLEFEDITGCDGQFITFRLGLTWAKLLKKNSRVLLIDKRTRRAFAVAKVLHIEIGPLLEVCAKWGHCSHLEKGLSDPMGAPERRLAGMRRIYGPMIATDTKKTTVIGLQVVSLGK